MAVNEEALATALHELIEALDRRTPRLDQAGEVAIARNAAALREQAVARLEELTRQQPVPVSRSDG